ncbi:hypothetical protein FQN54_004422 [Arachnomyces sp. PD_36]|nr:hypothetical protein FQN54_004422 [Arachnomyces sp. PD_36]
MRLLNTKTVTLEDFFENETPPYAILSHTWDKEEVTFQDLQGPKSVCANKFGYDKISHTCQQALKDGLDYAWVDTCCIDKSSSTELSEAINSMFRWYEKAVVCYAYLADVPPNSELHGKTSLFASSRWFTRGWTLQELLAPGELVFFSSDWTEIANRNDLTSEISTITGIDRSFLLTSNNKDISPNISPNTLGEDVGSAPWSTSRSGALSRASIAERMSWASTRETTRTEDTAYCLLGIFGIHMPLIYGEGKMAFIRFQEEIMKRYDDHSIFAWGIRSGTRLVRTTKYLATRRGVSSRQLPSLGFLAESPAEFEGSRNVLPWDSAKISTPFSVTNKGIQISLHISEEKCPYAVLPCCFKYDPTALLAVPVILREDSQCTRSKGDVIGVDNGVWRRWPKEMVYLNTRSTTEPPGLDPVSPKVAREHRYRMIIRKIPPGFSVHEVSPPSFDLPPPIVMNGPWSGLRFGEKSKVAVIIRKSDTDFKLLLTLSIRKTHPQISDLFLLLSPFLIPWWTSSSLMTLQSDIESEATQEHPSKPTLSAEPHGVFLPDGLAYPTMNHQKISCESPPGVDMFIVDIEMTKDRHLIWWIILKALLHRLLVSCGLMLGRVPLWG